MEDSDWQMHKSLVECNRLMLEKRVLIFLSHMSLQAKNKLPSLSRSTICCVVHVDLVDSSLLFCVKEHWCDTM